MSDLNLVQLGTNRFRPVPLFTAFQTLGETTTLHAFPTGFTIPLAVAGAAGVNPIGLIDNRKIRAVSLLFQFGVTDANNEKLAFDICGFSQIVNTDYWLRTRFFLGEAQAGNIALPTAMEATSFLADNFSLKTFAGPNVSYIEPADDIGGAVMTIDAKGFDIVAVRLAVGAATGGAKGQVWWGIN